MRYVWFAIMAVSAAALVPAAVLANPLTFLILGPDVWRERMARLRPYRWWILLALFTCCFAAGVQGARYG